MREEYEEMKEDVIFSKINVFFARGNKRVFIRYFEMQHMHVVNNMSISRNANVQKPTMSPGVSITSKEIRL